MLRAEVDKLQRVDEAEWPPPAAARRRRVRERRRRVRHERHLVHTAAALVGEQREHHHLERVAPRAQAAVADEQVVVARLLVALHQVLNLRVDALVPLVRQDAHADVRVARLQRAHERDGRVVLAV